MWQMAMSTDDSSVVTGANRGEKLYRTPVPAACASAAEVTKLSVRTSPVAARLNDRGGVVNLTAGCVAEVTTDSVTAVVALTTAIAIQATGLEHTNRATRLVTAPTLLERCFALNGMCSVSPKPACHPAARREPNGPEQSSSLRLLRIAWPLDTALFGAYHGSVSHRVRGGRY